MGLGKKVLIGVAVLVGVAAGSGWEDFLSAVAKNQILEDDGQPHSGKVYNAWITYKVYGNNDHKLGSGEKVYLKVVGPDGRIVETPQTGYTKTQLVEWAKGHANDLLIAIFGAEPTQAVTGIPLPTAVALTMGEVPDPFPRKERPLGGEG